MELDMLKLLSGNSDVRAGGGRNKLMAYFVFKVIFSGVYNCYEAKSELNSYKFLIKLKTQPRRMEVAYALPWGAYELFGNQVKKVMSEYSCTFFNKMYSSYV
jgi:hypothetical protein